MGNSVHDTLLMAAFSGKKSGSSLPRKAINLLDLKGNVWKNFEKAEFLNLTELPNPPSADGLTPNGWNWTLPKAKEYVQENDTPNLSLDIAPTYEPSDGKTRLYLDVPPARTDLKFGLYLNGTAIWDFGDGSEPYTMSGSNTGTYSDVEHEFPDPGKCTVTIDITGEALIKSGGGTGTWLILKGATPGDKTRVYSNALKKVEIGKNIVLGESAFNNCWGLEEISLPDTITSLGTSCFNGCKSLKNIILPKGLVEIPLQCFDGCTSLEEVVIPESVSSIKTQAFYNCRSLKRVTIPGGVKTIEGNTLVGNDLISEIGFSEGTETIKASWTQTGGYCISTLVIPSTCTSLAQGPLSSLYGLKELHMKPTTPPTVTGNVSVTSDCIIYVPAESVDTYKTAQYWSNSSSKIQAEPSNGE